MGSEGDASLGTIERDPERAADAALGRGQRAHHALGADVGKRIVLVELFLQLQGSAAAFTLLLQAGLEIPRQI